MSILWVLRKYIDSIGHREEEATLRRHREALPADPDGDDAHLLVAPPEPRPGPTVFRCRVCDHESSEGAYCSECLAPTMEPVT